MTSESSLIWGPTFLKVVEDKEAPLSVLENERRRMSSFHPTAHFMKQYSDKILKEEGKGDLFDKGQKKGSQKPRPSIFQQFTKAVGSLLKSGNQKREERKQGLSSTSKRHSMLFDRPVINEEMLKTDRSLLSLRFAELVCSEGNEMKWFEMQNKYIFKKEPRLLYIQKARRVLPDFVWHKAVQWDTFVLGAMPETFKKTRNN